MLNTNTVAAALAGLVGWHPAADANPSGPLHLPAPLLASRSGLFVQDASELLALEVLKHVCPRTDTLESWLPRKVTDALLNLVPRLAQAQGLDGRVLLPQTPMVAGVGRRSNTVNKLGRFVGVQLAFRYLRGVSYALPRVSLQLDGVLTAPLSLYLYAQNMPDPVQVLTVPVGNRAGYPYLVDLANVNVNVGYTGPVYLGYYEADLPTGVHAIATDFTGGPCGCANDPWTVWQAHVRPVPFSVQPQYLDAGRLLFDARYVNQDSQNFGLSVDFTGYCDIATALQSPDNQARLAPIVQLAIACRLLESIVASTNITQLTGRQDVQADAYALLTKFQAQLYGGKDSSTEAVYPSLLKTLTLDLSGLDSACQSQERQRVSMGYLVR